MDDQQRARQLIADWHRNKGCSQQVIDDCLSGVIAIPDFYMDLITAALRAPAGGVRDGAGGAVAGNDCRV